MQGGHTVTRAAISVTEWSAAAGVFVIESLPDPDLLWDLTDSLLS